MKDKNITYNTFIVTFSMIAVLLFEPLLKNKGDRVRENLIIWVSKLRQKHVSEFYSEIHILKSRINYSLMLKLQDNHSYIS